MDDLRAQFEQVLAERRARIDNYLRARLFWMDAVEVEDAIQCAYIRLWRCVLKDNSFLEAPVSYWINRAYGAAWNMRVSSGYREGPFSVRTQRVRRTIFPNGDIERIAGRVERMRVTRPTEDLAISELYLDQLVDLALNISDPAKKERLETVVHYLQQGYTKSEIHREFGLSDRFIQWSVNQLRLAYSAITGESARIERGLSPENIALMHSWRARGKGYKKIARALGCSPSTVVKYCKESPQ